MEVKEHQNYVEKTFPAGTARRHPHWAWLFCCQLRHRHQRAQRAPEHFSGFFAEFFEQRLVGCQRLSPDTPLPWRLLIAYDLTDEIFGLAIAQPGYLEVWYYFGAMCAAMPGWSIGTVLGVLMGNLMPVWAVSGCSVMLFGMFLAIIIPVGKQNRIVLGCIGVSFLCSLLASVLPFTRELSEGMRILVLTIVISAAAAILFPHKEDDLVA